MALILTEELNGRGNAEMDGSRRPLTQKIIDGREHWIRTGGDALILDTAKANGMVFRPWEIVTCKSGERQERQILDHCKHHNVPLRKMDWRDADLVKGYMDRHPEKRPQSEPGTDNYLSEVASLIGEMTNPNIPPAKHINLYTDINKATAAKRDYSATSEKSQKARLVRGEQDAMASAARVQEYADARWTETYEKHVDGGKSEKQARHYADKAKKGALRRSMDEEIGA